MMKKIHLLLLCLGMVAAVSAQNPTCYRIYLSDKANTQLICHNVPSISARDSTFRLQNRICPSTHNISSRFLRCTHKCSHWPSRNG